jgi:hypothetical protein
MKRKEEDLSDWPRRGDLEKLRAKEKRAFTISGSLMMELKEIGDWPNYELAKKK